MTPTSDPLARLAELALEESPDSTGEAPTGAGPVPLAGIKSREDLVTAYGELADRVLSGRVDPRAGAVAVAALHGLERVLPAGGGGITQGGIYHLLHGAFADPPPAIPGDHPAEAGVDALSSGGEHVAADFVGEPLPIDGDEPPRSSRDRGGAEPEPTLQPANDTPAPTGTDPHPWWSRSR